MSTIFLKQQACFSFCAAELEVQLHRGESRRIAVFETVSNAVNTRTKRYRGIAANPENC
jgi:hypothetical protein